MSVLDAFSLAGRVSVVTGAARGIGRALAKALARPAAMLYSWSAILPERHMWSRSCRRSASPRVRWRPTSPNPSTSGGQFQEVVDRFGPGRRVDQCRRASTVRPSKSPRRSGAMSWIPMSTVSGTVLRRSVG